MKKITFEEIAANFNARSAWNKGVLDYVADLLENLPDEVNEDVERCLLNGARNWWHYSHSGCSLCYDADIANRLCTASELKKTRNGMRQPNKNETWLDVQGRALYQAAQLIKKLMK